VSLQSKLETLLFVSSKPLTIRKMSQLLKEEGKKIEVALAELMDAYNGKRGISILKSDKEYQMASAPEHDGLAKLFYKDETTGGLTKPSLETLTIIAYRGPISKPELEEIRGVNCSLILRNLLIRGLVQKEVNAKLGLEMYAISMDFLHMLGIPSPEALPDYETLSRDLRAVQEDELKNAV
jgi:segregation and condensation protein B